MESALELANKIQQSNKVMRLLLNSKYDDAIKPYCQLLRGLMKGKKLHVLEALYETLNVCNEKVTDYSSNQCGIAMLCAAAYDISVEKLFSDKEGRHE